MRVAQRGEVGRAGIEPHIERVLILDGHLDIGTEQFFGIERLPSFDAVLLNVLGHVFGQFFQQLGRARALLAGFLGHKKAIGMPHLRWRESVQSWRFAIFHQ